MTAHSSEQTDPITDHSPQLPRPEEVRRLSGVNQLHPQPIPVIFEDLNLIVKYGPHVKIAEAQCLWIISRVLGNAVRLPEVHGWRIDGRDVFIHTTHTRRSYQRPLGDFDYHREGNYLRRTAWYNDSLAPGETKPFRSIY
jgi:hypothetical protein